MKPEAKRRVTRLALAVLGAAVVVAAYLRGDYLLGWDCGLVYAGIAAGLLSLLARSLVLTERPSPLRAAAIAALSLPLPYALAYPASINPGVQHFIDKQATDRAARAELAAVFASDPAYRDLSVSTVHVKVVNVTIRGSLPSR